MPGPSNYLNPTHTSLSHRSSFDEQYLQDQDDDEVDEEGELVKLEDPLGHAQGDGSGEGEGDADDQEPLYVNAKQYHRIVKRRAARARLEELNRLVRSRKVCLCPRLLLLPLPLLILDFILDLIHPRPLFFENRHRSQEQSLILSLTSMNHDIDMPAPDPAEKEVDS
jgi:hypothetical protein